jgi:hypothetical protein
LWLTLISSWFCSESCGGPVGDKAGVVRSLLAGRWASSCLPLQHRCVARGWWWLAQRAAAGGFPWWCLRLRSGSSTPARAQHACALGPVDLPGTCRGERCTLAPKEPATQVQCLLCALLRGFHGLGRLGTLTLQPGHRRRASDAPKQACGVKARVFPPPLFATNARPGN